MVFSLLKLPVELIRLVLDDLPLQELANLRCMDRQLLNIANDVVRDEYRRECRIAGVLDKPTSPATNFERLAKLRRQEHAWTHFQTRSGANLPEVDMDLEYDADLPNNSFLHDIGAGYILLGAPIDQVRDPEFSTMAINYSPLPTSEEGSACPSWSQLKFSAGAAGIIKKFRYIPSEDNLLAVITSFVHFLRTTFFRLIIFLTDRRLVTVSLQLQSAYSCTCCNSQMGLIILGQAIPSSTWPLGGAPRATYASRWKSWATLCVSYSARTTSKRPTGSLYTIGKPGKSRRYVSTPPTSVARI